MRNLCFLLMGLTMLSYSTNPKSTVLNINFETGTVTDADYNVYQTIKIGSQWWMAENLKTAKYSNGDSIIESADSATVSCTHFRHSLIHNLQRGKLYDKATLNDKRSIFPVGWHLATKADLKLLAELLQHQNPGDKRIIELDQWVKSNSNPAASGVTVRCIKD